MHSNYRVRLWTGSALLLIGGAVALLNTLSLESPAEQLRDAYARLLPAHMRGEALWKTITAEEVHRGVSVPAHVNVIFHLPDNMPRITRRTLFGRTGERIRYWGYCFPEDMDEERLAKQAGLPGKIFLSDLEQVYVRNEEQEKRLQQVNTVENLSEEDLNESESIRGIIRHQKDVFVGGDTCYLMTADTIPLGTDTDEDLLNSKLETDYGTNSNSNDTDDDDILDGLEVFGLKTNPTMSDSDGDAIPDGTEDKDHDGHIDMGETSPILWDSDRDGLCDGFCHVANNFISSFMAPTNYVPRVHLANRFVWEDKNINGIIDDNETDPLKPDTDGDGILDGQEYYNCYIEEGEECDFETGTGSTAAATVRLRPTVIASNQKF